MPSERDNTRWSHAWKLSLATLFIFMCMTAAFQFSRGGVEFPSDSLNATATHGGETIAMATGPMQDDVEGVFILDFATGDLTGLVVNPRTGGFRHPYFANVATDLQIGQGTQPEYLMVTGAAKFRIEGAPEPADSIVYVADAATGSYVAYWMPRQNWKAFYGFPAPIPMIVLHKEIRQPQSRKRDTDSTAIQK